MTGCRAGLGDFQCADVTVVPFMRTLRVGPDFRRRNARSALLRGFNQFTPTGRTFALLATRQAAGTDKLWHGSPLQRRGDVDLGA